MKKRERDMAIAPRLWLAAHKVCPPLANQFVLEGRGSFDLSEWKRAVDRVAEFNSGCRLALRGHMGFSHWSGTGENPPVRLVESGNWDGCSSEGAPFIQDTFSPRKGPMAEVVLIEGDPLRVVFRSHHAIMDGRGNFTWMEDVFRVLRGQDPLPAENNITENDLLNLGDSKRYPTLAHRYIAPTGRASDNASGMVWRRMQVKGRFPKLLIQVLLLTAREAWKKGSGPLKFSIPVDMRSRREGVRSYGNLTSSLYIEITTETTAESLEKDINTRLKDCYDGQLTWEDKILPHLPLWVLQTALKTEARKNHSQGAYRMSGIISNMGKIPLDNLNGGGFTSHLIWGVPVCIDAIPYSLGIALGDGSLELIMTMPRVLADGGRMETLMENIIQGLQPA